MKIKIENINFSYNPDIPILKSISTELGGESVAIIGQNGAGKTTFIRLLNGILKAQSGRITIDEVDVKARPLYEWAEKIGYVFQNPNDQLFQETVFKEIEFGLKKRIKDAKERSEKVKEIAAFTGLTDYLETHPAEMPYSQKKIITLASILSLDPEIILLDEPTAGQDWSEIQQFESILKKLEEKGKKIIAISHDMNFVARNFKRVLVFCKGEILIDNDTRTVFDSEDLLKRSFVVAPVACRCSKILNHSRIALNKDEFIENIKEA